MQINDNRYLTSKIVNAYLEIVYGAMILRHPDLHKTIINNIPGAIIDSSYSKQNENFIIHGKTIIDGISKEGLSDIKSLQNAFKQINSMFFSS